MTAYYNEFDPYAAEWLRNLIRAGHIADGIVDDRSIEEVTPGDLDGFTQCHFFAGIGVWSHALRSAGWPDDRPIWTGSCPCQPFSAAGTGAGFDDERHLWPAFFHLIEQRRPAIVLGEQVAAKDADPWIDLVCADVEAVGYAFGAVPFPSAGIGAPHIRDRLYWVAHADDARSQGRRGVRERAAERAAGSRGLAGRLADAGDWQREGLAVVRGLERDGQDAGRPQGGGQPESRGDLRGLADAALGRRGEELLHAGGCGLGDSGAGPVNGLWRAADWLACRDGKWRPVEPGTFPLAHGASARVGRLRAYGNCINAEQARIFIECVMEERACGYQN